MLSQQMRAGGAPPDSSNLVTRYQNALRMKQHINGRDVYEPLGQLEMQTLCELYQVHSIGPDRSLLCAYPKWQRD